jgi:DNA repair exonuclease SbcCD ATPase subunit
MDAADIGKVVGGVVLALLGFLARHVFAKVDGGVSRQGEAVQDIRVTLSAIDQAVKSLASQFAEMRGELRADTRARAELESQVKVQASQIEKLASEVKDQGMMLREATVLRIAEARARRDESCRPTSTG